MFGSFFLAGFEGSTGHNRHGQWFDHVVATGHDRLADQDYGDIAACGLHAARECIRWPLVDQGRGHFNFSTTAPFIEASRRHGVEVIWDLFHYGFPPDLDLFGDEFPKRFANYCHAAARYVASRTEGTCWFTPVNEPSYMAYAAGEKGLFAPYQKGRGWDLKVALARAAIAGMNAIRSVCPGARFVNVDPLCRVVAPNQSRRDLDEAVHDFNHRLVFQSWDMLAGRILPELGGSRSHLDVVGINYYWTNQWEFGRQPIDGVVPPLADDDPRRIPLRDLVRSVWNRYGGDILITETGHVGDHRGPWLRHVIEESMVLLDEDIPLQGICLYPIHGMPEWHDAGVWTRMGLWDPLSHREPYRGRSICVPMLEALRSAGRLNERHMARPTARTVSLARAL